MANSVNNKFKTKNCNTFRFKSFLDRVNEIDLRHLTFYHIGHKNEELPEDNETYFHQTLKKWIVLNLTEEFSLFSRKVIKIVSLPQLIHKKDFIIDTLLEHLSTATNLSLQPLLELLYILPRDLREEFYPYFQRILNKLIYLLNTQDAEQLEWTFTCLAYLFKTLKLHLKRNIGLVFCSILPLLDEQRYGEYIGNFAVECFSFIARDVKDYGNFFNYILNTLIKKDVESVRACGRLLFEIMRGVKGQFHSIAGDFLQIIFETLVTEGRLDAKQLDLFNEIVYQAIEHLLKFIYPQQIYLLWQKLCLVADNTTNPHLLANLVKIYQQVSDYREGKYLAEMDLVVPCILRLLDKVLTAEESLRLVANLIASILMSNSSLITQLDTSRLLKKALTINQRSIYEEFVLRLVHHAQFDIFILPSMITYFEQYFDHSAFELMAQVILSKHPLQFNAVHTKEWQMCEIKLKNLETLTKIENILSNVDVKTNLNEDQLLLLLIVPHLKSFKPETYHKILQHMRQQLLDIVKQTPGDQEKYLSVLILITALQYQLQQPLHENMDDVIKVLLENLHYPKALGCLNQLIKRNHKYLKQSLELTERLANLLAHHDFQTRLLAAHSLWQLHGGKDRSATPYHVFYKAACIEPNVHTYREQLLYIKQLHKEGELFKSLTQDVYKQHCVLFLLGMLYNNFKDVWEPVQKLLQDYCHVLEPNKFWAIYKEKMQETADSIDYRMIENPNTVSSMNREHWLSKTLNVIMPPPPAAAIKPTQQQLFNYRILLWQPLAHFGQLIEMKNREVVSLFLTFVETEYKQQFENNENVWNLLKQQEFNDNLLIDDDEEDHDHTVEPVNSGKKGKQRSKDANAVKVILQTLQTKLNVFAAYNNPKALYREPDIWEFYMDLLKGGNSVLQKSALDCIMSYKAKDLLPYKENLYNILDEKKLRNELINFKINEMVAADHRSAFTHIFLRLLYGKMLTKGSKKGMSNQQRKGLILRFLGECDIKEIEWFMEMAFASYTDYLQDTVNILEIPSQVQNNFNLHSVWSARKLQSALNLWEVLRKEFGGRMQHSFHVYMLKLLVFIGSVCRQVLQIEPQLMHPKMPLVYRNAKHNCLQNLLNFFQHLEEFEWSVDLIKCLTEVFVYPTLKKLPQDSIHTPTVLLKLLLLWGDKPKHFKLLRQHQEAADKNIFSYIMALLMNKQAKAPVRKAIMCMVERLLIAQENNIEPGSAEALELIEPHIPELLQQLKSRFETRRKGKPFLDKQDLNILSMLTRLVKDPNTCEQLLQILLPILVSKCQTQATTEAINQIINTLCNLVKRLDKPEQYFKRLAPFFEHIQEVSARKQLCNLIADIARTRHNTKNVDSNLVVTARIILLLNAWDKRWVEQPDYEKRLQGFQEIERIIKDSTTQGIDMDLGILITYNCFHFLRHDKDMALRDNASEHLRLLLPHLAQKYSSHPDDLKYLMNEVFIPLICRTIRDNQDTVRQEGIRLLGEMVRTSWSAHSILKDLYALADSDDGENDFFENIIHLQSHRHGRALMKFCNHAATLREPLQGSTLTKILLPLASRYLLREQYAASHTLIDAAIEAIGVVCQLLPWSQYQSLLKYYLMKLRTNHDYPKQCVRIVMRILDGFHFDLSLGDMSTQALEQLKRDVVEDNDEVKTEEQKEKSKDEDEEEQCDEEGLEKEEISDDLDLHTNLDETTNMDCLPDEDNKPCLSELQLLSASAAKKVLTTISSVLIPTLNRCITENSSYDHKHKLNRKRLNAEREEEEILRVPIALALVKLMQKLPKRLLDNSLPGVFMKVCTFLRSPLISVRRYTRDILKKIILCLGSEYLAQLMEHLQALLTRGFQVHVLSVTVYGILEALRDHLQPEHLESCLHNILEVALNDIFGEMSAEKEVNKLTSHTPEAKPSAKSYLVLQTLALNIRESCLLDLLMPFREHLTRSRSRKLTVKIQECFSKIVNGLVENAHLTPDSLLMFIYGTMSESISDLLPGTQRLALSEQEKEKMRRARPDCFIIPSEPGRHSCFVGKQVKTTAQVNAHILIEFGLELLYNVLKRKKLLNFDYEPFLNPLMALMRDSLKSTHVRVTVFTLKCYIILWLEGYKLNALEDSDNMTIVVERLFEILKNFSNFGVSKQDDNLQLVQSTFKAVVAVLQKCDYYEFSEEQTEQLTLHIEQDLREADHQSTTFNLVEALLKRKVNTPAMHDIMKSIRDMSITSQSDYVRHKARALLIYYVMECDHRKVDVIVKNVTVQLCYVTPAGRLSAVEFLVAIIKKFPLTVLNKSAAFLYLSLATRLVNDEDPECRKAVASCLEDLIRRLDKVKRQEIFNITLQFFGDELKPSVREMGAALCSRFVNVEKDKFSKRLKVLIPVIVSRLTINNPNTPGRFVRAPLAKEVIGRGAVKKRFKYSRANEKLQELLCDTELQEETQMLQQQALDHELLQLQYCLLKIFHHCAAELMQNSDLSHMLDELAYESQRLLAHEHIGVRCNAIKILTNILSSYDFEFVGRTLSGRSTTPENQTTTTTINFIYINPEYDIKALVLDLCAQVVPGETTATMIDDISKIFLFIATMLRDVPFIMKGETLEGLDKDNNDKEEEEEEEEQFITKINLNWLLRNIRYLINKEVTKANSSTVVRTALFTLMEGLIALLSENTLKRLAGAILSALIREMSEDDQNVDADLRQLALRVGSRLRSKIGTNLYSKKRIETEMKLKERRAERKKILAQEKVHDPERAAKRRAAIQERKKTAKKLKIDVMRGKVYDVKQKLKKRKRKADEDVV